MAKNSKANYTAIRAELNRAYAQITMVTQRWAKRPADHKDYMAEVALAETKGIIQALDNLFKDAR